MDPLQLHPEFPAAIWVVVEQPPGEERRLKFEPASGEFVATGQRSLVFARGFRGAYGWIGGLGDPPALHADALLVTRRSLAPGGVAAGWVVGMFRRGDGDHKVVAVDVDLLVPPDRRDLFKLDEAMRAEVMAVYPQAGPGEGWQCAAKAMRYLRALADAWR